MSWTKNKVVYTKDRKIRISTVESTENLWFEISFKRLYACLMKKNKLEYMLYLEIKR